MNRSCSLLLFLCYLYHTVSLHETRMHSHTRMPNSHSCNSCVYNNISVRRALWACNSCSYSNRSMSASLMVNHYYHYFVRPEVHKDTIRLHLNSLSAGSCQLVVNRNRVGPLRPLTIGASKSMSYQVFSNRRLH